MVAALHSRHFTLQQSRKTARPRLEGRALSRSNNFRCATARAPPVLNESVDRNRRRYAFGNPPSPRLRRAGRLDRLPDLSQSEAGIKGTTVIFAATRQARDCAANAANARKFFFAVRTTINVSRRTNFSCEWQI